MRAAVLVLLLPLLAGCTAERDDPRLERFTATYDVPASASTPAFQATVRFGEVVDYVDADGEVREGYAVDVDFGAAAGRLCRQQGILDGEFRMRRLLWGNGWNEQRECIHEQYDWPRGPDDWPRQAPFGVAVNIAMPPNATRDGEAITVDERAYVFDGLLAPKRLDWGPVEAVRTSYGAEGPLVALDAAARRTFAAEPIRGPAWPGSDAALPMLVFSLDDALAYLRAQDGDARAMLDAGGCVSSLLLSPSGAAPQSDLPVLTSDQVEGALYIGLTDGAAARGFQVTHGRRMPLGEPGFLGVSTDAPQGDVVPCSERPAVVPWPGLMLLLPQDAGPAFLAAHWWHHDDLQPVPSLRVQSNGGPGEVVLDGATGMLQTWHVARGTDIDP